MNPPILHLIDGDNKKSAGAMDAEAEYAFDIGGAARSGDKAHISALENAGNNLKSIGYIFYHVAGI